MTFEEDTARRVHAVGWYIKLDGISTYLATHDFAALHGLSGTFLECIELGSLEGDGEELDEKRLIVLPGDFSAALLDSPSLRTILRRKGGPEDQLSTSLNAGVSSLTLASGVATYADGATVFVDRETITLGTHTGGGTYTGCTRGAAGSLGAHHQASAIVSSAPRHMMERKATLVQVYLDTGAENEHRPGIMTASPQHESGKWTLTFTDFSTVLGRPLLSGFHSVTISPENIVAGAAADSELNGGAGEFNTITFTVPDIRQFAQDSNEFGHLKIEADGKSAIVRMRTLFSGDSLTVYWPADRVAGNLELTASDLASGEFGAVTLRQVEVVYGRAGHQALQVMLSDFGDGTVDSLFDILPGNPPSFASGTNDMSSKRVGAGLPLAWVDRDAWLSIPGESYVSFIDEETSLADFLAQEVLWRTGGHLYVTGAGKISWRRDEPEAPRAATQTLDLAQDTILASTFTVDDEEQLIARVIIECNYVPGIGYTRREEINFNDLGEIYGSAMAQLEFQSKSLWVGSVPNGQIVSPPMNFEVLQGMFDRMRAQYVLGGTRTELPLPWDKHLAYRISSRFKLPNDILPDHEGGVGATKPFRVVGAEDNFQEGLRIIKALEVQQGVLVAPAAFVASYLSTPQIVVSLDTSGDEADLFDADPGQDFMVDCHVRIYDRSATPPFGASDTGVVEAVSAGALQLKSWGGGFTPAAGDLVVLEDGLPGDTGNTNDNDAADVRDFAFGADSSLELADGSVGPRWG